MAMFGPEARERRHDRLERMQERAERANFTADLRHFRGLRVEDESISYKGAGAHASVKSAGEIERRITATRLVAVNVLGHARPSMTRDVYMGRSVVSAEAAQVLSRRSRIPATAIS
jgi:hypothetical protein